MFLCSTGASQGTSSFPVHLLHLRLHVHPNLSLQRFPDDFAILEPTELPPDERGKPKELVVDLCRHQHSPPALVDIQGMDIKRVTSYKHLGVHLNNKLDWSVNTDTLFKKWQIRLFLYPGSWGPLEYWTISGVWPCRSLLGRQQATLSTSTASSVLGFSLDSVEEVEDCHAVIHPSRTPLV